jgi:hypothetical protein
MTEYFSEMKNLADEMSSSGQPLGDKKFVSYVLTGLDGEIYNLLVSSIITRVEPISRTELFSQIVSYELHLEKQVGGGYSWHSSTNVASWGRGGPSNSGRGHGRSHGNGRGPRSPSSGGYTNNARRPQSSSDASGGQS